MIITGGRGSCLLVSGQRSLCNESAQRGLPLRSQTSPDQQRNWGQDGSGHCPAEHRRTFQNSRISGRKSSPAASPYRQASCSTTATKTTSGLCRQGVGELQPETWIDGAVGPHEDDLGWQAGWRRQLAQPFRVFGRGRVFRFHFEVSVETNGRPKVLA